METQNKTVIGSKTTFKGTADINQDIQIDGIYEGDINSSANIIVGKTGFLKGIVTCDNLTIYGKGEGNATCKDTLTIIPGGEYKGEITAKNLNVTENAVFDGTIHMLCNRN